MFVVKEGRADDGFVLGCRLPQQGVEVGDEAVTQADGVAHRGGDGWVHPRFVDGVVVVPGVDGKARQEQRALDPAQEEFGVGFWPGEAADVVADVVHAGEAHAGCHADIPFEGVPAGAVVAAPGLDVALQAGAAAARDEVGAFVRVVFALRPPRVLHHEQRHQRADVADGNRCAEAVAARVVVPDFVFVVVVPG